MSYSENKRMEEFRKTMSDLTKEINTLNFNIKILIDILQKNKSERIFQEQIRDFK
jgi:hypothetical protein